MTKVATNTIGSFAKGVTLSSLKSTIKKRDKVKAYKNAKSLSSALPDLKPHQMQVIKLKFHKFLTDYRAVASKRGSRTFDINRWINSNV